MAVLDPQHPAIPRSEALEKVAILDCGAQYTKVIDRRVRELNVYCDILPLETPAEALVEYSAVILSGGPNSVFAVEAPPFDARILHLGLPALGICYGMQLMAHHLGGTVTPGERREFGETEITLTTQSPLFDGLASQQTVLMSHGDHVTVLPQGFETAAVSGDILAAIQDTHRRLYGVQFHPEVELTVHGEAMLRHFLYNIAGLQGDFSLEHRLDETLRAIRAQVGEHPVFVLVSGGVDSAVTAALLLRALSSEQVYALHIDTGLMRHEESDLVCQALQDLGLVHLQHIKAAERFLNTTTEMDGHQVGPLCRETHPEAKRRLIGDTFFALTQEAIQAMHLDLDRTFIAQGTLRPDLIESGNTEVSRIAHKIKTHHNDVPIIQAQREKGLIVEPNRDWHKDEIRRIGRMLGLPEAMVTRQPFPGPGLGIRILCTEVPYIAEDFPSLNTTVNRIAQGIGLQGTVWPVQSVGVQGDYRTYSHLATLSGTYPKDWETLRRTAQEIPNSTPRVNRVALVINTDPPVPAQLEMVTPTLLTPETIDLLRQMDHTVTEAFRQASCLAAMSQLLAVLVPVATIYGRYSVAIRAVVTGDYMTARPARLGAEVPWDMLQALARDLSSRYPVDWVLYDLTSKPPATVEWE